MSWICGCVATVSTWPDLSWEEAVSRAKSQPDFATFVDAARKVWKKRIVKPAWPPESLGEENVVGIRVQQRFLAYTAEDLDGGKKYPEKMPEKRCEPVSKHFKQALLASRDVRLSTQTCSSKMQKGFFHIR